MHQPACMPKCSPNPATVFHRFLRVGGLLPVRPHGSPVSFEHAGLGQATASTDGFFDLHLKVGVLGLACLNVPSRDTDASTGDRRCPGQNAQEHGVSGLNINASRVGGPPPVCPSR